MTDRIIGPTRNDLLFEDKLNLSRFTTRWYTYFSSLTDCINTLVTENYGDQGVSIGTQFIPNATAAIYSPAGFRGVITKASVNALSPVNGVEIYLVPNGGAAGPDNLVLTANFATGYDDLDQLVGLAVEDGGGIFANDGGNGGAAINISMTATQIA